MISIALGGAALNSLEFFINDCYVQRRYCRSGVVVACDMARLPIVCPIHISSMIATFVGFVISIVSVLLPISNGLADTCYPTWLWTYCNQIKLCCRR